MVPKKGRRVRKIEVPIDSVPEFKLEDTVSDSRREEREAKEREEEAQKQREEARRMESRREEATYSPEERVAEKHTRTKLHRNRNWKRDLHKHNHNTRTGT